MAVAQQLPQGSCQAGDRHLNFHETRDNLNNPGASQEDHGKIKNENALGGVLGDDVLATAILDRLLHHCDVLSIKGPSYRLKDRFNLVAGGEPMP